MFFPEINQKTYKKGTLFFSLCLFIVFMMMPAIADTIIPVALSLPGIDDIDEKTAIGIAHEILMEKQQISEKDMEQYTTHANFVTMSASDPQDTAWVISVFSDAFQDPTDAVMIIRSSTGRLIKYEETNIGRFKNTRSEWEKEIGPYQNWSAEEQALFDRLYTENYDVVVPVAGLLSEETAISIALKAIPVDDQNPELQARGTLFFNASSQNENEQYIWVISLYSAGDVKRFQVNVSASTGAIINCFVAGDGKG